MKCSQRIFLLFILFIFNLNENYAAVKPSQARQNSQIPAINNTPLMNQSLSANLYVINTDSSISMEDGNLELYGTSYCDCVNWLEDSRKMTNFLENFAIERDNQLISIECRQPIGLADTVFYNMTQMRMRNYYLSFTAANLNHPNLYGFLQDSYTGLSTPINLNGNTVYRFSVNADTASANPNRFRIVFTTISLLSGVTPVPVTYTSVKAWQQNNNVAVQWQVDNAINVSKYEVEKSTDGVLFNDVATIVAAGDANFTYNWIDISPTTGTVFYRIKETSNDGVVQYSKIINTSVDVNGSAAITVYPNPVVSGIIGLQMENMPGGTYAVRLLNNSGQVLYSKAINHNKSSVTETINVPESISKGIYRLTIIHPDNTISNNSVVF